MIRLDASKTGNGAFTVGADDTGVSVWIDGAGEKTFATLDAAADWCRDVMSSGNAVIDGRFPYFGAANALEAILDAL